MASSSPARRPIVHCLVARPLRYGAGRVRGVPMVVDLETANWLRLPPYNWYVVGPDPEDLARLAEWEKETALREPFNTPRRS